MDSKNIVRTVQVALNLSADNRRLAKLTIDANLNLAQEYCRAILAMRCDSVWVANVVDPTQGDTHFSSDYWEKWLSNNLTSYRKRDREGLQEVFRVICKTGMRKGYADPLFMLGSRSQAVSKHNLLRSGVLPFTIQSKLPAPMRYQAWECASSYVASWVECDASAKLEHERRRKALEAAQLSADELSLLMTFIDKTELNVTDKLVDKMRRFGFDVYYAREEMTIAEKMQPNIEVWRRCFNFVLKKKDFEASKPYARFKFPCPQTHVRNINFGSNYINFTIDHDESGFLFKTKLYDGAKLIPVELRGHDTRQLEDLVVDQTFDKPDGTLSKSSANRLSYRRGNHSELDESVVGVVREVFLQRRRTKKSQAQYVFAMPVNISVAGSDVGDSLRTHYMSEPGGLLNPPVGTVIVSADHGVNPFWALRAFKWDGKNWNLIGKKVVGGIKDQDFCDSVQAQISKTKKFRTLLDYLKTLESEKVLSAKKIEKTVEACGEFGINYPANIESLKKVCFDLAHDLSSQFRQLKDYVSHPSRKTGVAFDQFIFLKFEKLLLSSKKALNYRGLPPVGKFGKRPGFEKCWLGFGNRKKDLQKKFAQSIVYEARKFKADLLVLEEFKASRSKKTRAENELWDLWTPLSVKTWVKHFAVQYGLSITEVDPRLTSQYDSETKQPGYRPKDAKASLYVIRRGNVVRKDADLDIATENIFRRFLDRPAYTYQIKARLVANHDKLRIPPSYVPSLVKAEEKVEADESNSEFTGKVKKWKKSLTSHVLLQQYDSEHVVFDVLTGEVRRVTPAVFKNIKTEGKEVKLYRHGERWLSEPLHKQAVEEIKNRVED